MSRVPIIVVPLALGIAVSTFGAANYYKKQEQSIGGPFDLPSAVELKPLMDAIDLRQAKYFQKNGKYEQIQNGTNIFQNKNGLSVEVQQYNGPRGVGYMVIYKLTYGTTTYVRYDCKGNDCPQKTSNEWLVAEPINSVQIDNL